MELLMLMFIKVLLLVHFVKSAEIEGRVDPLVLTNQGLVRGIRSSDGDFSSFLGIPYAQVNFSNPFGPALPAPFFEDVFQAYDGQVACPQTNNPEEYPTTLDCLRLNIYVPNEANSRNPLPVLVWIHGGSFELGKAGEYFPIPLVNHGIIFVTINYRLGPYGFLCLDTPEVPGNQGLKDQVTALRWLRDNIAAFGGNPQKITISGESAGSASVNLHLYSPQEKLFHQAILQSDTSVPSIYPSNTLVAIRLAEHLGFVTQSTNSALEFLSNTPSQLVTAAAEQLQISFRPCIEKTVDAKSFLPSNPLLTAFPTKTINLPVIIGVTSLEFYGWGTLFTSSFREGVEYLFDVRGEESERLTNIVQHYYVGDETDSSVIVSKIEQFDADSIQNYPMEREVTKMVAQGVGPVYNYVFEYVSENDAGDREQRLAPHTAELKYLFSWRMNGYGNLNEEEQEVSDRITALWTNFVKEGNPTPASSALTTWPAVSGDTRPYLSIGLESSVRSRFMHANTAFWELFYETYGNLQRSLRY